MKKRKDSPQFIITSYKRRQQVLPFVFGTLAVLLVAIGIIILVVWFLDKGVSPISLFSTKTPTPTQTYTPTPVTPTSTPTLTEIPTIIPTITATATASGPFEYTVEEGDNCWDIADKFSVDLLVLLAINNFGDGCPIKVGQKIKIPAPNQELPTITPLPADMPRGTKVDYMVQLGDTLDSIAAKHNSTVEDIIERNNITDSNAIQVGQKLEVRVNLVTTTPTRPATITPTGLIATTPTATVLTTQP